MISTAIRRNSWPLFFMILSLAAWAFSLASFSGQSEKENIIGLRYQEASITPAVLKNIDMAGNEEGPVPNFLAWAQEKEEASITEKFSGRSQSAQIIRLYGDGHLLFSQKDFIDGHMPIAGDQTGCAISTALARALWGSANVKGMSLELDGHEYLVLGLFENDNLMLIRQNYASENLSDVTKAKGFACVEFEEASSMDGQSSQAADDIRAFLQKTGLPQPSASIHYAQSSALFNMLSLLPCLLLLIMFMVKLVRHKLFFKRSPLWQMLYYFLFIAALLGFFFLVSDKLYFSRDFLPSKWSDFEFWGKLFKQSSEDLNNLFRLPANDIDLERRKAQIGNLAFLLASLFLVFPALSRKRTPNTAEALFAAGLALCVAAVCSFMLSLRFARSFWLAWPLYYLGIGTIALLATVRLETRALREKAEGDENE